MSVNSLRRVRSWGDEASYIHERVNTMAVIVMEEDARVVNSERQVADDTLVVKNVGWVSRE